MGTLRSNFDHTGMEVNGMLLGTPARELDENENPIGPYIWDDSKLPNGEIDEFGDIIIDEVDV